MGQGVLLYVEDDDASKYLVDRAIRILEIPVKLHRVSDGEQALQFLRKAGTYGDAPTPDLILLDLNLPRIKGLDVLKEIKTSEVLRGIPVVIFTSSLLSSDRTRSIELGAQGYINKPFNCEAFTEAVKSACAWLPV